MLVIIQSSKKNSSMVVLSQTHSEYDQLKQYKRWIFFTHIQSKLCTISELCSQVWEQITPSYITQAFQTAHNFNKLTLCVSNEELYPMQLWPLFILYSVIKQRIKLNLNWKGDNFRWQSIDIKVTPRSFVSILTDNKSILVIYVWL